MSSYVSAQCPEEGEPYRKKGTSRISDAYRNIELETAHIRACMSRMDASVASMIVWTAPCHCDGNLVLLAGFGGVHKAPIDARAGGLQSVRVASLRLDLRQETQQSSAHPFRALVFILCILGEHLPLPAHSPSTHLCHNMSSMLNPIMFKSLLETDGGKPGWRRDRLEDELRGCFNGGVGE